jgi:Sap, sulfolipid-1-addressing protein
MWIAPLLVMAAAVSLEPFRIGMTVLMLNRPRPLLQLLTFLTGGFLMGITVGAMVLFVLRPALGSAYFTLPRMQMVYLAALTLIVASGAAAATQVGALLLFNVVAFGLVEIPLISYLAAPDHTRAALSALHDLLRTRRRHEVAALLATVGCVLLVAGFVGL